MKLYATEISDFGQPSAHTAKVLTEVTLYLFSINCQTVSTFLFEHLAHSPYLHLNCIYFFTALIQNIFNYHFFQNSFRNSVYKIVELSVQNITKFKSCICKLFLCVWVDGVSG